MKTMNHFIYKHCEEIAGTAFALLHSLYGTTINFMQINLLDIAVKVMADIPGFFAAGFFGGLGGYVIRIMIKMVVIISNRMNNKTKLKK